MKYFEYFTVMKNFLIFSRSRMKNTPMVRFHWNSHILSSWNFSLNRYSVRLRLHLNTRNIGGMTISVAQKKRSQTSTMGLYNNEMIVLLWIFPFQVEIWCEWQLLLQQKRCYLGNAVKRRIRHRCSNQSFQLGHLTKST